jgi:type IV secretion/conjugal transfer VirB4 family ATPase
MARTRALMDILPWDLFVGEGLLLAADGALTATVSYRGPDPASSTEEDLVGLARILVQATRTLGDGWLLHFDLHRVPAPEYPPVGAFPDPYTRALDEDRRRAYRRGHAHYISEQHLSLTFHPGSGDRTSPVDALLRGDLDERSLEGQIQDFENALEEILGALGAVLRIERLDTSDMLRYLYRCLTFRQDPLEVPVRTPYTLEHLLGCAGDLYGGTDLRFGETHIVPIRFAGFPEAVGPSALDILNDLPLPFRASFRYIPLDAHSARGSIRRLRSHWNTAGVGFRQALAVLLGGGSEAKPAFSERFAPAMAQDADDALLELETSQLSAGYLTPTFFTAATDREEASRLARRLLKHLRNAGYAAAVEDLGALDAYLGALPGNGRHNVRRPLFTLSAAVHLAPATSVWAGEPRHPHPHLCDHPPTIIAATSGSTPFALSAAVGDVQHAAVIGPTGSGKSVLLNLLLAQYFRYPGAQVFSLDKGYSQLALAAATGGAHYDLTPDPQAASPHRFAPLENLGSAEDLQRASEWTLALLEIAGLEASPALLKTIGAGLRDLRHTPTRTLAAFALKAQSHEIRDALDPYILDGPYAHLFDAARSPIRQDRFAVFEMESVLALREAAVAPLVLHLFNEVERRLAGQPTLLAVEELSGYLHRPLFARAFSRYLLELRKKNAGLVLVNQSVTALLDSPLRSALLESCPTKIFLPNPSAMEPSVAEAYRSVGLNDRQIEILAEATPKRDYYVATPLGARLFRLDLSPAALAILGLAGPTARQRVDEALATWGPDWVRPYLAELGHDEFCELLPSPATA